MKTVVELDEIIKISESLVANGMFDDIHPRGEWDLIVKDGSFPVVVVSFRAYSDERISFVVRKNVEISEEVLVNAINRRFQNALSYEGIKSGVYTCQL